MIQSNLDIILYGGPGAGKGTQAKILAENLNAAHLEMGEEIRKIAEGTTPQAQEVREIMESGKLVPFSITSAVTSEFIGRVPLDKQIIFDGYPRSIEQAEDLDDFLQKNGRTAKMVYIILPDSEAINRLVRRANIEHRPDDLDEEAMENRLAVFHREAKSLLEHYKKQGRLVEINGDQSVEEVAHAIAESI